MSSRPKMPAALKQQLLYDSAFACVVCQSRAAHIHHIDENNTNNTSENLVALCQNHHDEAHTKYQLSQNLTADRLKQFKQNWHQSVKEKREMAASASSQRDLAGQFLSVGVSWGYINHGRVAQMLTSEILGRVDQLLRTRCENEGIIDHRGLIIRPKRLSPPTSYVRGTIYDWFDHAGGIALHILYSELVDELARAIQPIHLFEQNWTKTFVKAMLDSGSVIFLTKAQYFKRIDQDNENAHLRVRTFRKNIEIVYHIDTRDMFGTTSITCSFSGHQTCSSLLQVKSINEEGGKLLLSCTPIALGVGFQKLVFLNRRR